EYQSIEIKELSTITGNTTDELIKILAAPNVERVAVFFNGDQFEKVSQPSSLNKITRHNFYMKSLLAFPLMLKNGELYSFSFYSRRPDVYNTDHIGLLHRLNYTITGIIEQ